MKNPFNKNLFSKKKSSEELLFKEEQMLNSDNKDIGLGDVDNITVDNNPDNDFDDNPSLATHGFVYDNYEAPESMDIDDPIEEGIAANAFNTTYNNGKWYSVNGRIGRIKLLSYSFIWGLVLGLLIVVLTFVSGTLILTAMSTGSFEALTSSIVVILMFLISVPITIFTSIILPRRRLHDIGKSGWWLLLYFVPIASLLLLYWLFFKAGDKGVNSYGAPSEPNSTLDKILAGLAILGLVSYVFMIVFALTQYQKLVDMQSEMTPAEVTLEEVNSDAALEDGMQDDELTIEGGDGNSGEILNTNPEADPEVQAAIEAALGNNADPVGDTGQANPELGANDLSYEEFLRASETPVMIEEAPPEPSTRATPAPNEPQNEPNRGDANQGQDIPADIPDIRVE